MTKGCEQRMIADEDWKDVDWWQ